MMFSHLYQSAPTRARGQGSPGLDPRNVRQGTSKSRSCFGWGWSTSLLAAALFLPAGLGAQLAPPPTPAPPQPPPAPSFFVLNDGPGLGQSGEGAAQVINLMPGDAGWLGISVEEVSSDRARQEKLPKLEGVHVSEVEPDSPAAKAGVKTGDVIIGYNDQSVEGTLQFRRLVRETPPGRTVSLRVWRDGASQTLSAKVTSQGSFMESRLPSLGSMREMMRGPMRSVSPRGFEMFRSFAAHPLLGVNAEEVEGQLGQYFEVPGGRGVLVVSVNAGSAAEKAGIKAGDVIYQVAGKPVDSVEGLEQALRDNCSSSGISITLVRKGATLMERAQVECPPPLGESSSTSTMR